MSTDDINELTRQEWRELGFFYDRNDDIKEWQIRGSRVGLLGFARILLDYSRDPRRRPLSEHDHFGPYMYLKIGTWSVCVIDDDWIAGTPEDLGALSVLITEKISKATKGDVFRLRDAFAPAAPYELLLEVCADEFDPAAADGRC